MLRFVLLLVQNVVLLFVLLLVWGGLVLWLRWGLGGSGEWSGRLGGWGGAWAWGGWRGGVVVGRWGLDAEGKAKAVECLGKTPFGKAKSLIVLVLFMGGLFIQETLFDC